MTNSNMNETVTRLLGVIINPNNGKTLKEEGRIVEIKAEQNELVFKYKRDGITPEQKKIIENSVNLAVNEFYSPEKITILTISENSSDVLSGKIISR